MTTAPPDPPTMTTPAGEVSARQVWGEYCAAGMTSSAWFVVADRHGVSWQVVAETIRAWCRWWDETKPPPTAVAAYRADAVGRLAQAAAEAVDGGDIRAGRVLLDALDALDKIHGDAPDDDTMIDLRINGRRVPRHED
jgi:hypothetical protein